MKRSGWMGLVLASAISVGTASSFAMVQTAGQDIKNAGTDTKDAGKDVGHGVKKGTTTGYKKTKSGTKKAYHKTSNGTKKAYHKTGEGVAKTGDKMEGK